MFLCKAVPSQRQGQYDELLNAEFPYIIKILHKGHNNVIIT